MPLTSSPARPPATRIAVTSGKGGLGKTSLSVNLAVALSRLGHRVGLVDADLALGDVDVQLGLSPEHHLGSVLNGTRTVEEIAVAGPSGVRVLSAGSGVRALTALDGAQWARLAAAVSDTGRSLDFIVLDTATGVSDLVLDVIGLADYVIVLVSYEPASVVDAYALIKLVSAIAPGKPIGVVVNPARHAEEADIVFGQISRAAERFLRRSVNNDGYVIDDPLLRESLVAQEPVVLRESGGPASRCFRRLAGRLAVTRSRAEGPWAAGLAAAPSDPEAPCA